MRNHLLVMMGALGAAVWWTRAEPLPSDQRPDWLNREGIIMAGSWEPLLFRVRRDGSPGYAPSPEQVEGYRREQSPEMVARLKELGVNFVMMHCYKGAGLQMERESMADAVRFAGLCREQGLHVGVYNYSGAFLWEPFFKERPDAKDWVVCRPGGQPRVYEGTDYRYYWNRSHPAAEEFYRGLVRFAVQEIKTDLVHFDNYVVGPGYDDNSAARFRQYLGETFTTAELATLGVSDLKTAQPPTAQSSTMLRRAWDEFTSRSLAESYQRMSQFARGLRSDILVECNPNGVPDAITPPVDHGRLLDHGEAYWVESGRVGLLGGKLVTRIRNYKVGRALRNMTFDYTVTPLEMAESMAFNVDCLGCVTWFEYGQLLAMPGSKEPMSPALAPFIRFFREHRDLLRDAKVVADLAVVRSFPSQVFGGKRCSDLSARLEQILIENRFCFQIIYDTQLRQTAAGRFPILALAGCAALSDDDVQAIRRQVAAGGKLGVIGPLATHDGWMRPRTRPALEGLPKGTVLELSEADDWRTGVRDWVRTPSLAVDAQPSVGLCTELTEQANRRVVHFVNYRTEPSLNAKVQVRLPASRRAASIRLVGPEQKDETALQFTASDGVVRFQVPRIGIYEIAVVELADANGRRPD